MMSEDASHLRIVFDCMVYLQAVFSEVGPASTLLHLVDRDELVLFVSDDILEEVQTVLSRPKIRQKNPEISDERVEAFIQRIREKATVVNDIPQHFTYLRDPKDEKYINLAVEINAHYLISRDRDLLDLMTGYTDECKDFRRRFRPLRVIDPVELLNIVLPRDPTLSLPSSL